MSSPDRPSVRKALALAATLGTLAMTRALMRDRHVPLPTALPGRRETLSAPQVGTVAYYASP